MKFDPFILPFSIGLVVLSLVLLVTWFQWIKRLPSGDKLLIKRGIFRRNMFAAIKEVLFESLLHRKIFRVNPILGFMHMTFAFGWFLLIVFGHLEAVFYTKNLTPPPYYAIFFNFFFHDKIGFEFAGFFAFVMDFILLWIVLGVTFAVSKRFASKWFGMKKTTRLKLGDTLALTSLWLIFPLRLLAESFTSGLYNSGGFLTGTLGYFFSGFLPVSEWAYPAWWAYSFSLGIFFVALPFSRYMHIPTEVLLIFLRNSGVKAKMEYNSFSEIEVRSCPKCGICIDVCQLNTALDIENQSVHFIQSIRNKNVAPENAFSCLLCGKCKEYCPVGIDTSALRIAKRKNYITNKEGNIDFLPDLSKKGSDVIYFAGCMTHLVPSVKQAMLAIFREASVNYLFLDEKDCICCGRPLLLAGYEKKARQLMEHNKKCIKKSGVKLLVTSCPICYKVFTDEYNLDIKVMHHTQYILELVKEKKINVTFTNQQLVYHDPCELGRSSGVYEEPRQLIKKVAHLQTPHEDREIAPCCGGSLGGISISNHQRNIIRDKTLEMLSSQGPEAIVTACPLCKKTFTKGTDANVLDIAEIIANAITPDRKGLESEKIVTKKELVVEEYEAIL